MLWLYIFITVNVVYIISYSIAAFIFFKRCSFSKVRLGVVFNHRIDRNGNLSRASILRLDYCVELYNRGFFDKIFCVGGYDPQNFIFSSELNASYLIESGVNPQDIHEVSYSFNTWSNCSESIGIMKEYKYFSAVFVSSPLHLLRISRTLKMQNYDFQIGFTSPGFLYYFQKAGVGQIVRELIEESLKVLLLLMPRSLYRNIILNSLQTGKLKKLRRISKF